MYHLLTPIDEVITDMLKCIEETDGNHTIDNSYIIDTKTSSDDKQFQCNIYGTNYDSEKSLIDHSKETHTENFEKKHKCTKCSYETDVRCNLRKHLRVHSDVRPYQCELCKTNYKYKNNLNSHMKNKHKNCQHSQTNSKKPTQDLKLQQNVKKVNCYICNKSFTKTLNLQVHIRNRHLEGAPKDYKCPMCPYETNFQGRMLQHAYSKHTRVSAFDCIVCGKGFFSRISLNNHIKDKHMEATKRKIA